MVDLWSKDATSAADRWKQKRELGTGTGGDPRGVTNSSVVSSAFAERAGSLGTN